MENPLMDITIGRLAQLAKTQGGTLQAGQLRAAVEKEDYPPDALLNILRALKQKGIRILTEPTPQEAEGGSIPGTTPKALEEEEKRYLKQYLQSIADAPGLSPRFLALFPSIMEKAQDFYCEEILLDDLIQEATMALLSVLEKEDLKEEAQLEAAIQELRSCLLLRGSQADSDRALVEKVEKLEQAIRDLNDGEGERFTIQELSIILDMPVEEIHGILRLTGDDDGQSEEE